MITHKLVENLRKTAEKVRWDSPKGGADSIYYTLLVVANEIEKELKENKEKFKRFPYDKY